VGASSLPDARATLVLKKIELMTALVTEQARE
jgi:hypothetical protein